MQAIWRCCRTARKSPRLRRAAAALALGAYLLAIVGLPVWQPAGTSTEPFACQHRRCGCRSAAQCWTSCCCFTLQQRIAWARANNVKIPAHALARAERETQPDAAKPKTCGHCCAQTAKKAAKPTSAGTPQGRVAWVDAVQAQRCQGISHGWMTLSVPLFPPPRAVVLELEFPPLGQLSFCDARELTRSDRPASRPG